MERDKFTCRDCGSTQKTLNVHHCHYHHSGEPWRVHDAHLLTVCQPCHMIRQMEEGILKNQFAWILASLSPNQLTELGQEMMKYQANEGIGLKFGVAECASATEVQ
jgi:hypothetical protein